MGFGRGLAPSVVEGLRRGSLSHCERLAEREGLARFARGFAPNGRARPFAHIPPRIRCASAAPRCGAPPFRLTSTINPSIHAHVPNLWCRPPFRPFESGMVEHLSV